MIEKLQELEHYLDTKIKWCWEQYEWGFDNQNMYVAARAMETINDITPILIIVQEILSRKYTRNGKEMARWSMPKRKVICSKCGWKGKRTKATFHYLCPICYPVGSPTRKFGLYPNAISTIEWADNAT